MEPYLIIVGGNPARVIGNLDAFVEKRRERNKNKPKKSDGIDHVIDYFWGGNKTKLFGRRKKND